MLLRADQVAPGLLTLVARKAIVETLALGSLIPLRVGLLAATAVAASARGAVVTTHGLTAIAGGGLGLWTGVSGLLTRTEGTWVREETLENNHKRVSLAETHTTAVLVEVSGGCTRIARSLSALGAVLLAGIEALRLVRSLVLTPLRHSQSAVKRASKMGDVRCT